MSEYQWVHFLALDQPLDDKQLEYMQQQSSRADVSRHEFTNEYHYSDFRGNTLEMLRRGYDVHLHFANFGIRKLLFRLPLGLPCDLKTFKQYCPENGMEWIADKTRPAGILEIQPEADAGTYDYLEDMDEFLPRIASVREMLMRGDLRPLYVAWLATEWNDEAAEPPVPAGLGNLPDALEAMAEFYEVDLNLIAAAAEYSEASPADDGSDDRSLKDWLAKQSKADLRQLVLRLLHNDARAARAEVFNQVRRQYDPPAWPVTKANRTLGEIRKSAETIEERQIKQEEAEKTRARRKRLDKMAADPNAAIKRIEEWVNEKSSSSYAQAASDLADLREALGPDRGPAETNAVAERLRKNYPTRITLISSFRKQNFLAKQSKR